MGEYYTALRRCLTGIRNLPIHDESMRSDDDAAANLQQVFFDEVIKELDSIAI